MVKSLWKGGEQKNASEKSMGPCDRLEGKF